MMDTIKKQKEKIMKTKNKIYSVIQTTLPVLMICVLAAAIVIISLVIFSGFTKKSEKQSVLPYYNTADFTPVWNKSEGEKHTIPDFSYTDQNGNSFGSKELEGKIYAVDFFFTTCPGICPKLTTNLSKVQDAYKNDPSVMLVSFSVTPETDNAAVLKNYAEAHNINYDKWRLLTGSRKDIYTLARQSYFADEDLGLQSNENDFLHTENVLLIDGNGRIRGIYKGTYPLEIEKLIKEIGILEKESTPE
jgi:protein SCO1/2